jgi:hypothetical protein
VNWGAEKNKIATCAELKTDKKLPTQNPEDP